LLRRHWNECFISNNQAGVTRRCAL
jgi:hypothetical protein